jgi:CBS domain-containing protein
MAYRDVGALIAGQDTVTLAPAASAQEAAEAMAERRIGAIAVVEDGKLRGIFTERDLLNRVVAKGLQPREVRLEEVMTKDPVTVESDTAVVPCIEIMFNRKFRHMPVTRDGRVVGVLSCRDIPVNYFNLHERWEFAMNELRPAAP